MTSNNSVNFKVFLRDENSVEARRFFVDDASVVTNFFFMKEKLQMIFPKLRDATYRITWKDSDGDEITVDSDEDLITAFTEMNGTLKVLYVTILERKPDDMHFPAFDGHNPNFRGHVVCDVCERGITGYRYKCLQCPDYDLCGSCEYEGNHAEHIMLRMSRSELPFGRCTRKMVDHINKSIRKAGHVAYKEACRASRYRNRFERQQECRKGQESGDQQKAKNDAAESSNPQEHQQSGCPMQDLNFEHITPLIYPFLDALSNNAPAAAAAASASASGPEATDNNNTSNATNNPQTPHFMNLIRNAINGFFEDAAHAQQQNQQTQQRTDSASANIPTATTANSSQASSGQATPSRNIPMEVEKEPEVPKMPSQEPLLARREPGWTLVFNNENPQAEPEKPTAPLDRENSKIADGLRQLLDMGFSDELNLVALLKRFDGNVAEVVKYLFEHNI